MQHWTDQFVHVASEQHRNPWKRKEAKRKRRFKKKKYLAKGYNAKRRHTPTRKWAFGNMAASCRAITSSAHWPMMSCRSLMT